MLVGAVSCRLDKDANGGGVQLYIMTLGVLERYRRLGVGRKLLDYVLDKVLDKHRDVKEVRLHVQVNNDAALAFYAAHGFEKGPRVADYYKDVEPKDAFLLTKAI